MFPPIPSRRDAACLAILLASASCMPQVGARRARLAAPPATAVARAPVTASTVAAPLPMLLGPAAGAATGTLTAAAPAFVAAGSSPEDAERAIGCLTEAVYYEARSEPLDGQRAVAQVVLNRVRNPAFPASVCGVVHQRASAGGGCQFSFVCDGSMRYRREEAAWAEARQIAVAAYGGAVYAPAASATFYHTVAVSPWWASGLDRIATIGRHIFYQLGADIGRKLDFRQSYAAAEPVGGIVASEGALAANVARYLTPDGPPVTVHRGADTIDGIVVHRGAASEVVATGATEEVHVHVGSPPAPDAVAASAAGPDCPATRSGAGAACYGQPVVHEGRSAA